MTAQEAVRNLVRSLIDEQIAKEESVSRSTQIEGRERTLRNGCSLVPPHIDKEQKYVRSIERVNKE
jgi:hypothetical protein